MAWGLSFPYTTNGYYRTQWLCNVTAFQPDAVFERGLPRDVPNREGNLSIQTADDIPDEFKLVVLSPQTARIVKPEISLIDYIHPDNAMYFFGADTIFMSENDLGSRTDFDCVYVPNFSGRECDEIYSFVAGAIVCYDRIAKYGH